MAKDNLKIVATGQRRQVSYNGWDQVRLQDNGIAPTHALGSPEVAIATIQDYIASRAGYWVIQPLSSSTISAGSDIWGGQDTWWSPYCGNGNSTGFMSYLYPNLGSALTGSNSVVCKHSTGMTGNEVRCGSFCQASPTPSVPVGGGISAYCWIRMDKAGMSASITVGTGCSLDITRNSGGTYFLNGYIDGTRKTSIGYGAGNIQGQGKMFCYTVYRPDATNYEHRAYLGGSLIMSKDSTNPGNLLSGGMQFAWTNDSYHQEWLNYGDPQSHFCCMQECTLLWDYHLSSAEVAAISSQFG